MLLRGRSRYFFFLRSIQSTLKRCEYVVEFFDVFAKLRKSTIRSVIRIEELGSHWTDFHEIWYLKFFENLWRKFKFHLYLKIISDTTWDQYTFLIMCHSVLLKIRIFSDKFEEKIKTHVLWSAPFFFFFENCAVYEIMWKNIVEPDRPRMTVCRMRIVCLDT
jgi:hypothetical protein